MEFWFSEKKKYQRRWCFVITKHDDGKNADRVLNRRRERCDTTSLIVTKRKT